MSDWRSLVIFFHLAATSGPLRSLAPRKKIERPTMSDWARQPWLCGCPQLLERIEQLSIHSGRHSFASHLLKRRFSLVQVRDWLGHSSISTTSAYLHVDPDEGGEVGDAFDF